jgi:hypothetical protein
VGPIFIASTERLLCEQPSKSRAVNEQIAFDCPAVSENDRLNLAILLA